MVGKVGKITPLQIFDPGRRPSHIMDYPVPKVSGASKLLDYQDGIQQAEFSAYLLCAEMKHQRRLLDIILDGKNYS